MNETKLIDIFSKTDKGLKRPNNEDEAAFLNKDGMKVLLVADGMGGHQSGEVASRIAKETIMGILDISEVPTSLFKAKHLLKKAMKKANALIHRLSSRKSEYYGMGTTAVMAIVLKENTIIVNCGDSRGYAFYADERGLVSLTTDQTVVEYLYKLGAISKDEMKTSPKRHVLMNALGIAPTVEYDVKIIPNDYTALLVCSDGLTNMVEEKDIEKLLSSGLKEGLKAETIVSQLILAALNKGGIDNIGISLLEVKES
ncbi:MAG: protein phosphatase 2C domain-containing protein [Bacilli bacterium]|jgi:protein phosphatase|nr:protein phosphatase 2C domain-containing protein [Bacilli bacterium]